LAWSILLPALAVPARADGWWAPRRRPAGRLIDHTHNHGADHRIWSPALGQKRDLYVYLPPGYDPRRCYPAMLWLHGIGQDEGSFPADGLRYFDDAIAAGRLPPMIIAMPDGSYHGKPGLHRPSTMFLNSDLGDFEDFAAQDVWSFVRTHYSVRPERGAHVVAGFSGGGAAAYRIAIRYREEFATVFGVSPPLNFRWVDCHGRYFANFDPDCWGWRQDFREHEVVGRFFGVVTFRLGKLIGPLYGVGPDAVERAARDNPIEMLDAYDVRPGELGMLVAYGGRDQFNLDAQVESFVYRARQRSLEVAVEYAPCGGHNLRLAEKFFPATIDWLGPRLAPYGPVAACAMVGAN
jgi:hypothetical protein